LLGREMQLLSQVVGNPLSQFLGKKLQKGMVDVLDRRLLSPWIQCLLDTWRNGCFRRAKYLVLGPKFDPDG
jgi:hypothetical protein